MLAAWVSVDSVIGVRGRNHGESPFLESEAQILPHRRIDPRPMDVVGPPATREPPHCRWIQERQDGDQARSALPRRPLRLTGT